MSQSNRASKLMLYFELAFKIELLIYVFVSYNNLFYGQKIMSLFVGVTTIMGFIVLAYRLLNWHDFIHTKHVLIMLAFCVSYIISLILNVKYGFLDGIKALVWMTFQYLLLYACDTTKTPEKYKKEFYIISDIFIGYVFICACASFVELFLQYSSVVLQASGHMVISGMTWGRLWGVYIDPNYASVFATISIILSLYFINKYKKIVIRIFYCLNILIQVAYIAFSDSRTGLLCLVVSCGFYTYAVLNEKGKIKLNAVPKQFCCVGLALAIALASFAVPYATKVVYNDAITANNISIDSKSEQSQLVSEKKKEIGRDADLKEDISNRRFALWESGIEIFETKPIFGVSFYNLENYAMKVLPKTYLINNDLGKFDNIHNALLNILVGQGIIGIVIAVWFLITIAVYVLRRIWKIDNTDYSYAVTLLSCVVAAGICMMFVSDVFYVNSPTAFVFWGFLGYLVHLLSYKGEIKCQKLV